MECQEMEVFERRKKKNDIVTARDLFDELPEDLKIDILSRLATKLVVGFAFISKSWFRLITTHFFPKPNTRLPYSGMVLNCCLEPRLKDRVICIVRYHEEPSSKFDDLLRLNCYPKSVVGCCNNLLLHCKRDENEAKSSYNYSYYVVNPFNPQWTRVNYTIAKKPAATAANVYAALAYDPFESSFYKIVLFQGFRYLDVYFSETKSWKKLKFWLPNRISTYKTEWIKHTVFFQGALYRLSMSGHLLRFVIDKELSSIKDQAQAIDLPHYKVAPYKNKGSHCLIGVNNDHINYMAFDEELNLCIWVLTITDRTSFEWSLKYKLSKIHERYESEDKFCRPLGFHPYLDIVYVGTNSRRLGPLALNLEFGKVPNQYVFYSKIKLYHNEDNRINYDWDSIVPFSFFYSPLPFANGIIGG